MLQEVFARLQDKGIKLDVTDAFKESSDLYAVNISHEVE